MKFPHINQPEIPPRSNWTSVEFVEALCSSPQKFKEWWNESRNPSDTFGQIK